MYASVHTVCSTIPLGKMEACPHAGCDSLDDVKGSQQLSNVAQVRSVSYWADFDCQNKVGQVTANSPGTVTSPLIFGETKHNCVGRTRSVVAQLTGTSPAGSPKNPGLTFPHNQWESCDPPPVEVCPYEPHVRYGTSSVPGCPGTIPGSVSLIIMRLHLTSSP